MTYQLPPLPKSNYRIATEGDGYSPDRIWSETAYTEEDMLRYAREAIDSVLTAEYQRDQIASAQSEAAFKANQEAYR